MQRHTTATSSSGEGERKIMKVLAEALAFVGRVHRKLAKRPCVGIAE
jgi:hypothetical protein